YDRTCWWKVVAFVYTVLVRLYVLVFGMMTVFSFNIVQIYSDYFKFAPSKPVVRIILNHHFAMFFVASLTLITLLTVFGHRLLEMLASPLYHQMLMERDMAAGEGGPRFRSDIAWPA